MGIPGSQPDGRAKSRLAATTTLFAASFSELAVAASAGPADGPALFGIPVDFILFALALLGFALLSKHFEDSKVPAVPARWRPPQRKSSMVFVNER